MADFLQRVFRPAYGSRVSVSPKRWWSRKDRRSARMAAAVMDHGLRDYPDTPLGNLTGLQQMSNEDRSERMKLLRDQEIYGTSFQNIFGERIDPRMVMPSRWSSDPDATSEQEGR